MKDSKIPELDESSQTHYLEEEPPINPRDEVVTYTDGKGVVVAGTFVEAVKVLNGHLIVSGWKFGPVEIAIARKGKIVDSQIELTQRPDVEKVFGLDDSSDLGFQMHCDAQGKEADDPEFSLWWRVDSSEQFSKMPFGRSSESPIKKGRLPRLFPEGFPFTKKATPTEAPKVSEGASAMFIDYIDGPTIAGWSYAGSGGSGIAIRFGGIELGHISPDIERPDVRDEFQLDSSTVGFKTCLGGILLYAAAFTRGAIALEQLDPGQASLSLEYVDYAAEAATIAPLQSLIRRSDGIGAIKDFRAVNDKECVVVYETPLAKLGHERLKIEFYEEDQPGSLSRIHRSVLECDGEFCRIDLSINSLKKPLLIIVSSASHEILGTDTIPLPLLFLPVNNPLIEYHSVLASGVNYFNTAARIMKNFLMAQSDEHSGSRISRQSTAVVLFDHRNLDPIASVDAEAVTTISDMVYELGQEQSLIDNGGNSIDLDESLSRNDISHFIFLNRCATLRPDFWGVLSSFSEQLDPDVSLVYGDSLFSHGTERPILIRNSILNDPVFQRFELCPIHFVLVTREQLKDSLENDPSSFSRAAFRPEHAFADIPSQRMQHLPMVFDQAAAPLTTTVEQSYYDQQLPLPSSPCPQPPFKQSGGISVIINYRNTLETTQRCLDALSLQEDIETLEIVLVNNRSAPACSRQIVEYASQLFGETNVKSLDYDQPFDHSDQCNLAVEAATQEFLLMLSNDAIIASPHSLAEAREVCAVPWVGTCGFRIVTSDDKNPVFNSLGLSCAQDRYMFAGGRVLGRFQPPQPFVGCTLEVAGNTFAAACMRKEVYLKLGGLDSNSFPTNYNDVDFSLRATNEGYRHVAIGSCIVTHSGRGSRGIDLDLPIDARILDRIPSVRSLSRHGMYQL